MKKKGVVNDQERVDRRVVVYIHVDGMIAVVWLWFFAKIDSDGVLVEDNGRGDEIDMVEGIYCDNIIGIYYVVYIYLVYGI